MPLKFLNFSNFSHILRADISKSKRCFNVKSSTSYFRMTTKILADFQICIRVPLRFFRVLCHIFFNMRHFRLKIFQTCCGTQRNHTLDGTGTKTILWKAFLRNVVYEVGSNYFVGPYYTGPKWCYFSWHGVKKAGITCLSMRLWPWTIEK